MTDLFIEAVLFTLLVGGFLIPIMLAVILVVAACWHTRSVVGASPPSR